MRFFRNHHETKQQAGITAIQRYGELLLSNPDGTPRVALHDVISVRRSDGLATTSRMSFYKEADEYRLDESHDNSKRPTIRQYVRPADTELVAAGAPEWESGTVLMEWSRFSPEPTPDVRPFVKLLEQCFGKLPR